MIDAHADVVGSLLRPAGLLRAREDLYAGRISLQQFKAVEDRAVDEAVALQQDAGMEVVTDGEMRRLSFQSPWPRQSIGNRITVEDEKLKLRLITETARKVWG